MNPATQKIIATLHHQYTVDFSTYSSQYELKCINSSQTSTQNLQEKNREIYGKILTSHFQFEKQHDLASCYDPEEAPLNNWWRTDFGALCGEH